MIIDAHQHVFWMGLDDDGLIADMDQRNIDMAWLLTWEILPHEDNIAYHDSFNPVHIRADGTHPGMVLADAIKARDKYPERFILGYCPDPSLQSAPRLFEAAVKIHNVKVCGECKHRILLDDPRCLNLFRKSGDLGCPVIVHIDVPYLKNEQGEEEYCESWYGGTVENLVLALEACPDTNFLGHAPGFWREISGDSDSCSGAYPDGPIVEGGKLWQLFEKYDNLYGDLSAGSGLIALKRDSEHAKKFISAFSDKLLFARDNYSSDLQDFLNTLNLSQDIKDNIYFKNAQKLLK